MFGARLRELRESTGLEPERFARLAGVDPSHLSRWESNAGEPTPEEADAVARVVGVRVADLGAAGGWPLQPFLFRAVGQPGLHALEESRTFGTLGDALRTTADVYQLEQLLGLASPLLPRLTLPSVLDVPRNAKELAAEARARLGLGPSAPIVSMRALIDQHRIRLLFVRPDKLSSVFQAASTMAPRPMILVNLVGGPDAFWQARMAIAHELGHLLFDHGLDGEAVNVSTAGLSHTMRLSDDYSVVETRADAFAANFLAPSAAVRDAVGDVAPSASRAIQEIARRFGIGRVTAINRLTDVYKLPDSTRDAMLNRDVRWDSGPSGDVVQPDEIGFAPSWLCVLVGQAVAAGVIDRIRAREILGLMLSDELPASTKLDPHLRRPLRR